MEWKSANILFADVKGYSSLTDAGMKVFHEKVLSTLSTSLNDLDLRDRNTWGDGIVFIGDRIGDVCEAALLLRDKFKQINWKKLGIPKLDIRISIHHGEYLEGVDPFTGKVAFCGKTVVTAARIEPVTPPGMVWITNAAATMLQQHMDSSQDEYFEIDQIGEIELPKGFGPLNIWVLRRNGEAPLSETDIAAVREAEQIRLSQADADRGSFCVLIGVVTDGKRVLLVQRRENDEGLDWMFPSGKKFPTDDPKYAIQKEVLEETGIHSTYRKKLGEVASHPITKQRCHYIYLEPDREDELPVNGDSIENKAAEWVSIDEAFVRIGDKMNQKVVEFLRKFGEAGAG